MNQFAKKILENTALCTVLALTALMLLGSGMAGAQVRYLDDGAIPNTEGGWDLPAQGSCSVDALNQPTRPDCVALRIVAANSTACTTALGSWTTSGVCNDLINTTQVACEAAPDRKWNAGTGVCAVVMMDDDRNNVVCAMHQGTWVTTGTCIGSWIMPARDSYNPDLLTGNGAGDQCLRCHNGRTQYNGPRVRDTQETLYQGHKNMSRKVTPPMPWGGPPFACTGFPAQTTEESCFLAGGVWDPTIYPGTDSGQDFDWANGTVDIGPVGTPNPRGLYWIYADWLSAYPRAVYHDVADTTATPDKPKVSYSCARCHTTGWTADTVLQATREPEASFPGITWDGVADAVDGQVNLAPGAPYNTKMASWDLFGITCTRCHNSAVDLANPVVPAEVPVRYNAPAGMASHHNNLTVPDVSSGTCTDPRFTREFECTANSGLWLTACSVNPTPAICTVTAGTTQALCEGTPGNVWTAAPFCSNARYNADQTACTTNGFSWTLGWCTSPTAPTYTPPATYVCPGGQTARINGSQGSCQVAGGNWTFSKCSLEGVCNDPTNVLTRAECNTLGGQFAYATDVIRCEDAGGHWTGNNGNRGQIITNLCMNCHRQETGGLPYDSTNPATALKVGPYHGTVPFLSHPHANQFLNSPHAKFTGTFAQIPTGKFNYAMTGEYKSFYMTEGEAAGTGNGCTGCHEVHTSIVTGDSPFREECTECHAKDLGSMLHPGGTGTPMENLADPMEACVSCHMPEGEHLFRINVDPLYKTRPTASMTTTANANTAPDGDYAAAVWVDLDSACGKCHGGGVANVVTTGSITAGTKLLTVPNGALFTGEQRIEIKGAGSPYYDDDPGHTKFNDDFSTYVVSVAGNVVTLAGNATKTVTNAVVEQNPVKNGAGYKTKATLAVDAKAIHNDKPYVTFAYNLTVGNSLQVNVDASFSTCSGDLANCDAFEWSWGDASPDGSGVTASHTYAVAGTYNIKLTVHEYGVSEGSVTKSIRTFAVDTPPAAGGTDCASIINPNTWVATLVDNSTDNNGVKQVTVNWGDGGTMGNAVDTTAPYSLIGTIFTRTYLNASAGVVIKQTAYDTKGQTNVRTCAAVPLTYFTISGGVYRSNGTTPVPSATVVIKKGTTTVKTVYTNSLGLYSATNLKPGTYTVTVTKAGFTFAAAPQASGIVIGPNATVTNINAVTP